MLFMENRLFSVLFLCTGNSARSIIAEATLNSLGKGKFKAYSAGSLPGGTVNPLVLDFLKKQGVSTEGARSKSWDEFAAPGAPKMDFVITVCDQAAGEVCPVWPGHPVLAHWGVDDPARYMDDPERATRVIQDVSRVLRNRIMLLTALPVDKLDRLSLQTQTREIGKAT